MDHNLQMKQPDEQEAGLPVCSLLHRVKNSIADPRYPYKYKCCDARDCHWKKHDDDKSFCLFDQAHW
jgi:hypothetical protein